MRLAKPILVAVLGLAFAAYGFDCSPMTSADQAMECCHSMNCSHGMHGEDCCQNTPSMHAPFVQPASIHNIASVPLAFVVQPASILRSSIEHGDGRVALRFHDPPLIFGSTAPLQLRI